jgi:hypothetical protein
MVSPEGIVPARNEPEASCGVPEGFGAKPSRAERGMVSPEGIESKNGDFGNTLVVCDFWR